MFYLELDQDQRCATRGLAPGSASQPCTYAVESSGRIAVTSSAVPMLGRYLLKPVPSGAVGTNAKFRGPGLEAVEEVLLSDEPPRHRGWCSPS